MTDEGESVLAEYDDWAIRELRSHQMIWSGWGPATSLSDVRSLPGSPVGVRSIQFADQQAARSLRLFFLSLLWRAAATDRPEFVEVHIPDDELEVLRGMVLSRNPEPFGFYPVSLVQLSTLGERHNHSPLAMVKQVPSIGDTEGYEEPIFRFYFDGLIVHFSRSSVEDNLRRNLSGLRVGEQLTLSITTTTYEASTQAANLALIRAEATLGRPLNDTEAARVLRMF